MAIVLDTQIEIEKSNNEAAIGRFSYRLDPTIHERAKKLQTVEHKTREQVFREFTSAYWFAYGGTIKRQPENTVWAADGIPSDLQALDKDVHRYTPAISRTAMQLSAGEPGKGLFKWNIKSSNSSVAIERNITVTEDDVTASIGISRIRPQIGGCSEVLEGAELERMIGITENLAGIAMGDLIAIRSQERLTRMMPKVTQLILPFSL